MHPALYNKNGTLKHSAECKMLFGKKDAECPRCTEMLNGAPARTGWQQNYFVEKKKEAAQRFRWLKKHSCEDSGCMTICTYGDW